MDKIDLFQTQRIWPVIRDQVMDLVDQEHAQGRAQNGPLVQKLEHMLAERFNRRYCVTFGSCSDAMTAAMISLELPPGTRVAVSDYTFSASAHAIARAGYQVRPLDVGDDYCIQSVPDDVSAVMAVDIFGNMTQVDDIPQPLIMDAAQSLDSHDGQAWSAERGVIACVSFSPSKTVSSWGSGGAALTDDVDHYQKLLKLRLHGKIRNDDDSIHPGMNSMLSSFETACIIVGLGYSQQWRSRREEISRYIMSRSRFAAGTDFNLHQHGFHKLVLQSPNRDSTVQDLAAQGITAVCHYRRLMHQESLYPGSVCPNSERLSSISFTVPNQHTLTDSEVERIAKAVA